MATVEQLYRKASARRLREFQRRAAGDDVVSDIACVAEQLMLAHSMTEATLWDALPGERRIYWALMLDAVCSISAITLEQYIERVRTSGTALEQDFAKDRVE